MPTLEIFTSPLMKGVNGIVYNAKPLLYNNVLNRNRFIESDFAFSDGKRLNKYEKENHFTLCKIIRINRTSLFNKMSI